MMFILYKKLTTLNLLINDFNISLISTDSLKPDKAVKAIRIIKGLF
jgi:hypothetical protein